MVSCAWRNSLVPLALILLITAAVGFGMGKVGWSLPPLVGRIIVVDPGHGGIDGGTHDQQGLLEKNLNLEIAHWLRRSLKEAGAFVVLTREGDHELSYLSNKYKSRHRRDLNSRVLITEKSRADLLLSIHINAAGNSAHRGSIIFFQPDSTESKSLALLIQEELSKIGPHHTRSPLAGRVYYILRNSEATAVLLELGFITNQEEKKLLSDPQYQQAIARAITAAVIRHFTHK